MSSHPYTPSVPTPQVEALERLPSWVRAAASGASLEQGLLAVADLSWREAAAWLLTDEARARASCAPEELRRVVRAVCTRAGANGSSVEPALLRSLALGYHDLIDGDTATRAIQAGPVEEQGDDGPSGLALEVLRREPRHADLLRLASQMAARRGDVRTAHALLTRLGRADASSATIQYVRRARAALSATGEPMVRIALVSSFTVDPLAAHLDLECRELGLTPELYIAPFNSWTREMLDESSGLRRFHPEIVFLAVSIDDLVPDLEGAPSPDELRGSGAVAVDRVLTAARSLMTWHEGLLVVHGFHSVYRDPLGALAGRGSMSRARWLSDLNARLAEGLLDLPRAYLLDVVELLLQRAGGAIDNPKMRHLAGMRLGEEVLGEIARAHARYIAPWKGLTRKCVVVDLDNTLWGGIVGEGGPHGIKLGDTSPGSEYVEFQRYLLTLTSRGFLLAINSKNNPDDALAVIRSHEAMLLREASFSAIRINWQPKTENMVSLAEELGIGVDAMVFLDDNPHERELMRQLLPQVLTPELPADPARFRSTVESLPHLQTLVVTDEDRMRGAQYQLQRQREQLRESVQSLEAYLASLGIEVAVAPASDATLPRVLQLVQRTNQFNLTARRYDAGQLADFQRDATWRIYTLRARDRFGDHGLVAAAFVRIDPKRWTIDNFLMSCRVIGLGIETAVLAAVSADARGASAEALIGEYVETTKNAPVRDFFARHGFAVHETRDGVSRWGRSLTDGGIAPPPWIRVVG